MIRLFAALMALVVLLTGAASAATLTARPSTVVFEGSAEYAIDVAGGAGAAVGLTSDDAFDLFVSGFFDPGAPDANPVDVDLTLTDVLSFDVAVNARAVEEVEIGAGFVALLFGDIVGSSASSFIGGKLLAIFTASAFPALSGDTAFELRRLDDVGVIPLPATALLLLGGLSVLGLVRRRRR